MMLNIELKGPMDEAWALEYDYDMAAQKVVDLINKYDISSKTMVSSFVPKILSSIMKASDPESSRHFMIQALRNRSGIPDYIYDYGTQEGMTGINISYDYLEEGRCSKVHSDNKYLGIWYSGWVRSDLWSPMSYLDEHSSNVFGVNGDHSTPEPDMWEKAFTIDGGVDFFYSDYPLQAMELRE